MSLWTDPVFAVHSVMVQASTAGASVPAALAPKTPTLATGGGSGIAYKPAPIPVGTAILGNPITSPVQTPVPSPVNSLVQQPITSPGLFSFFGDGSSSQVGGVQQQGGGSGFLILAGIGAIVLIVLLRR
jgi:hypothetical protein